MKHFSFQEDFIRRVLAIMYPCYQLSVISYQLSVISYPVFVMTTAYLYLVLIYFFRFLSWIIIARVVLSWFAPGSRHPLVVFVVQTSEVIIAPIRNALPRSSGSMAMIDWSPLIALILLDLIRYGLIHFFVL